MSLVFNDKHSRSLQISAKHIVYRCFHITIISIDITIIGIDITIIGIDIAIIGIDITIVLTVTIVIVYKC